MSGNPIIVGVDGSAESIRAAVVAHRIAATTGAPCVYVYAAPEPWPAGLAPLALMPGMYDGVREHIVEALRAELPEVAGDDVVVRTGRPGDVLVREAQDRRAVLVVVGARRHGALARGLGGSTAHYLARALDVPLLSVSPFTRALRRVLVAVDLSDAATPTLRVAGRQAAQLGAQLRALHVMEPARFPIVVSLSVDEQEFERRSRAAFERIVAAVPEAQAAERVLARGAAAETIAEAATAWEADLIVVGSHGKGWAHRMLIGSTTERLLNLLPASVLVVPITRATRSRRARASRAQRPRRRPRGTVVI